MYCEYDQASLCWDCDSRVHTANFLVAKHVRTLLCHACQCLTPWTGSGPRLGPTLSVCEACVNGRETESAEDEEESGGLGHVDDDDSENQVVPLSLPPSSASSSSSSSSRSYDATEKAEEKSGGKKIRSWKWRYQRNSFSLQRCCTMWLNHVQILNCTINL